MAETTVSTEFVKPSTQLPGSSPDFGTNTNVAFINFDEIGKESLDEFTKFNGSKPQAGNSDTLWLATVQGPIAKELPVGSTSYAYGRKFLVASSDAGVVSRNIITIHVTNEELKLVHKEDNESKAELKSVGSNTYYRVATISKVDTPYQATDKGMVALETALLKNKQSAKYMNESCYLGDGGVVAAAGGSVSDLDESGFMEFAQLITQQAFLRNMNDTFNADGTTTVHDYIARNLDRFYHQLYYVPNLVNNYCIVVKPETLFINIPKCNIIYPNIKSEISFSRNIKSEPTRIMQVTDPISGISGVNASALSIVCMLYVEEQELRTTSKGIKQYRTFVNSSGEHSDITQKNPNPMTSITNYERRNGLFATTSNQSSSFYFYLTSTREFDNAKRETCYRLGASESDKNTVGTRMAKLARYELIRQRYTTRTGSCTTYFNPYIVPGFPFMSVESYNDGCNIYGYVTSVAHNITDRSWSTTFSFNCAHFDNEYAPVAFPIVEYEYTRGIADTYKNMLGDTVAPVNNADVTTIVKEYTDRTNNRISSSYRQIWRETTSIDDYLSKIADGATIDMSNEYWVFNNGSGSEFFDTDLQARIKQYAEQVMVQRKPFTEGDVRS